MHGLDLPVTYDRAGAMTVSRYKRDPGAPDELARDYVETGPVRQPDTSEMPFRLMASDLFGHLGLFVGRGTIEWR
jgi:hypothetical protein